MKGIQKNAQQVAPQAKRDVKPRADIDLFLEKVAQTPALSSNQRGRLIFALDATMSRQPTWDLAQSLQGKMFETAAAFGGLDVQLLYFRGFGECKASPFVPAGTKLAEYMAKIDVRAGTTQIAKVLKHVAAETRRRQVRVLVFVGDAMEESADLISGLAGELALLGVKAFVFQEGKDAVAERSFRDMARLTGGAYASFDLSAPDRLAALLAAAAAYAAGGKSALQSIAKDKHAASAQLLLSQIGLNGVPYLLLGALVFWIGLAAVKAFARANPASLARLVKRLGGMLALGLALVVLLLGRLGLAIGLAGFGFWLLGISGSPMGWFQPLAWFQSVGGSRPQKPNARVRSAMIDMELDHETGKMRGLILSGPDEGKQLDDLTRPQCEAVYRLCLTDDPDGARLLEAYMDRRFPGWREADERDGNFGGSDGDLSARSGAMSEEQAYQILGLQKGAAREAIIRSHHALMKKLHPDHGGSTDLAARVNEAKDVLLRRHF